MDCFSLGQPFSSLLLIAIANLISVGAAPYPQSLYGEGCFYTQVQMINHLSFQDGVMVQTLAHDLAGLMSIAIWKFHFSY